MELLFAFLIGVNVGLGLGWYIFGKSKMSIAEFIKYIEETD